MSFMSDREIEALGLKAVGKNVSISPMARFHNPQRIAIGSHARIDDYCILSAGEGGISIGRYVHIGCFSSLIGSGAITMEDFSGLSGRVSIYSSNDDFSGMSIPLPTVPAEFRNFSSGPVTICRHAAIGAGSVLLPKVTVGVGAVVGALSMVQFDCAEFGVYRGTPATKVSFRSRNVLQLEARLPGDA